MENLEFSGKSVDDAVINAKQALGLTSDEIEYVVVEKGGKGFLGLGSKEATIKAWKKGEKPDDIEIEETDSPSVAQEEKEETVKQPQSESKPRSSKPIVPIDVEPYFEVASTFIQKIADKMGENVEIKVSKGDDVNSIDVELVGENMGLFIGKRGQTLDAIQYLTSIVVNTNTKSHIRVKLDTENYRERRKVTLENLASNMARRAVKSNRRVALDPMSAYERRIIHAFLQNDDKVDTYSEGVEPYRKVVIIPNTK